MPVVEFLHERKSPDIIWGQLKRSINAIAKQLELAQFEVLRSSCITDEKNSAALAFLLESITLPPYTKKKGHEVFRRKDTDSFLSNTKTRPLAIWVDRETRIALIIERKATDARKFVRSVLPNYGDKNINSGGASNIGISKDLIKSGLQIYSGTERKKIKRLAKEVSDEVASTESLIFRRGTRYKMA